MSKKMQPRWVRVERFVLTFNEARQAVERETRQAVVPFAHAAELIDEGWRVIEVGEPVAD